MSAGKRWGQLAAAADEHAWAMADLQDAIDQTTREGDCEEQRVNIRRARDREQAAHEDVERERAS